MKKLVSLMLTGALAFSLSTGALAAEEVKSPDNDLVVALQAVQYTPSFFQKSEYILRSDHRFFFRVKDQTGILTEGTAEIAAAEKDRCGSIAGIIQQSQCLKSMYRHNNRVCFQ